MGWKVGAAWALIGFAGQCVVALLHRSPVAEGLARALVHYVAFGVGGIVVGTLTEYAIADGVRARVQKEKEAERPAPPVGPPLPG